MFISYRSFYVQTETPLSSKDVQRRNQTEPLVWTPETFRAYFSNKDKESRPGSGDPTICDFKKNGGVQHLRGFTNLTPELAALCRAFMLMKGNFHGRIVIENNGPVDWLSADDAAACGILKEVISC